MISNKFVLLENPFSVA